MSLFTPDAAEAAILTDLLAAHDYALKLFLDDKTPAAGDTEADYTEATFPGYAPIVLTLSDWTIAPGDPGAATAPLQTWTQAMNAPEQLVYGYYVARADTGELRWVERFVDPGPSAPPEDRPPFAMQRAGTPGDQISVLPRLTLRSQP